MDASKKEKPHYEWNYNWPMASKTQWRTGSRPPLTLVLGTNGASTPHMTMPTASATPLKTSHTPFAQKNSWSSMWAASKSVRVTSLFCRRSSYYWLCNVLGIYCPVQWEFSRLNVGHTLLSKRKIQKLLEESVIKWEPRNCCYGLQLCCLLLDTVSY